MPETCADFVNLVVPELQRRGVYKSAYQPATLRAKFQGADRIQDSLTGAAFRTVAITERMAANRVANL